MPKPRVIEYWQAPAPDDFVTHIIEETGLNKSDQRICWSFRDSEHCGDTVFYAEKADMTEKRFSARCAWIFRTVMPELIRLAIIGYRHEKNK